MNTSPNIIVPSPPSRRRPAPEVAYPRFELRCGSLSDRGLARENNEDRCLVETIAPARADRPGGVHLLAVADGVGGVPGGATASTLAIKTIEEMAVPALRELADGMLDRGAVIHTLRELFRAADERVSREGARQPELHRMATTLTVAVSFGHLLFIGHIGDSRAYLLRRRALGRLTTDHTMAADWARRGLIDNEEANATGFRHVLTQFVGGGPARLHVELHEVDLWAGDLLLLCSDGLTEMVPSPQIADILMSSEDPETACQLLVERANQRGGRDNVTVAVARCDVSI